MKDRFREFQIESIDDKNYRVDRVSIIKDGDNKGKESFAFVGYYGQIEHAIKTIAQLLANKADDLNAWLVEYRVVKEEIETMITRNS